MTKTVLVLPGCSDTSVVEMFRRRGWDSVMYDEWIGWQGGNPNPPTAICFTGGTDVDPKIYGEEPGPTTEEPDHERDAFEVSIYEKFKDTDVYLFGICRGAQLLNVLNGGRMIQEVGYRGGRVEIVVSDDLETALGLELIVTKHGSIPNYLEHDVCHHQGMVAGFGHDGGSVYGFSQSSTQLDYVIHYPETRSYGVQGHPEWGHKETEDLFFAGIDLVMKQEGSYVHSTSITSG